MVIDGDTGLGKIELAEHIVMHCATQFQMMPIFGTMGPRPGQAYRMALELLRSTIAVKRHLEGNIPLDDLDALEKCLPQASPATLQILRTLLLNNGSQASSTVNDTADIFETTIKEVINMLTRLKTQTPLLVVLQFEHGTSLFSKTSKQDEEVFWKMTAELTNLVKTEKAISGLILCKNAPKKNPAVESAVTSNSFLELKGLSDENVPEYMSNYLDIPFQQVPPMLRRFITQMTNGNPLFVREILDQLTKDKYLTVKPGHSATLGVGALERIKEDNVISQWNHTSMVGGTVCVLESLDPNEAAALKMSTCFECPFTLPDLAASNCSQWGGATHLELLRLFRAVSKLVERRILEHVAAPSRETPRSGDPKAPPADRPNSNIQHFQMQSELVRTVGAAMVLEAQKKSVKRNALIDRVLKNQLPERLRQRAAERSVIHIPWYYERALRRMQ